MASGSEIAAGAGGLAGLIPAVFGRGQSQHNAQDISHSQMYDPYAYQFGAQGAGAYAGQREAQANAIDNRGAFTADYQQADMDRRRALEARSNQSTVMNQLMARAAGTTPSIAQMQADRQMGQAAAQQSALQASARGPAALALSQQTAANNTANVHGAISNQAQQNAATERLNAEQAAFGAASGMRGQDYQSQGQAANQAQFQAGMQQTNRNANDQRAMGYSQMGHQGYQQEQQGKVQMQAIAAQSHANAQAQNAQTERQNAGNKGLLDTVGDFFSSDANAKMILPKGAITSDFMAKTPLPGVMGGGGMTTSTWGAGGTNPMSGAAPASFDALSGSGGMDPMASLQKHSDFATQYQADPTGGMTGGAMGTGDMMLSDARAKEDAFKLGMEMGQAKAEQKVMMQQPGWKPLPAGPHEGEREQDGRDGTAPQRSPSGTITLAPVTVKSSLPEFRTGRSGDGPSKTDDEVFEIAKRGPEARASIESDQQWGDGQRAAYVESLRRAGAAKGSGESGPFAAVAKGAVRGATAGIVSDFSAKNVGLTRDAFGNPAPGDPSAPRMIYIPGQGWADPSRQPSQSLEAAMQQNDGPDFGDKADQDARIAKMQQGDAENKAIFDRTRAEMAPSREDIARDDASRRKEASEAPDRAAIAKADAEARENGETTPSAKAVAGKPSFLSAFAAASQGLNEAQFGRDRFPSDFKSKRVVDLDNDVDVDNDPGGQDFDADEYVESKFPKPYDRQTFHRDTPAEQRQVKRSYEDSASKDADSIMAGFGASLGKGSAVDQRVAASRLAPEQSPEAQAARTMKGFPYAYKPGLGPKDQAPGEMNYGFMTQNLRQSPIAATAVKKNPQTGLDEVDAHKMIKVMASTIADLQEQQDETRLMLAKGGRRK